MNPLDRIEEEVAQRDMGKVMYRIYSGARKDGGSRLEAFLVCWAWSLSMFQTSAALAEDEDTGLDGDE